MQCRARRRARLTRRLFITQRLPSENRDSVAFFAVAPLRGSHPHLCQLDPRLTLLRLVGSFRFVLAVLREPIKQTSHRHQVLPSSSGTRDALALSAFV